MGEKLSEKLKEHYDYAHREGDNSAYIPYEWIEDAKKLEQTVASQAAEIERLRGKLAEIPVSIAYYERQGSSMHPRMKQTILELAALEGGER